MVIAAEFYSKTATKPAMLDITVIENGDRRLIQTVPVLGRADARRVAARFDAKPWNF